MRTHFYGRSAYDVTTTPVPRCFLELDAHFDARIATAEDGWRHRGVELATVLCMRAGDVAYFGEQIAAALDVAAMPQPDTVRAGIRATTLVVAHLGACKAVLDAGAVALAELYGLGQQRAKGLLLGGDVDFRRGVFRTSLRHEQPAVHARYARFFPLVDDIVVWRDAAVHRKPPLIMLQSPGHPRATPVEDQAFHLILRPEATIGAIAGTHVRRRDYASPMHFHDSWYDDLVAFCGEVCQDIAATS